MPATRTAVVRERQDDLIVVRLVGQRIDDAEVSCETYGFRYRTVFIDGQERKFYSDDVCEKRVNFTVVRGIVTKAVFG